MRTLKYSFLITLVISIFSFSVYAAQKAKVKRDGAEVFAKASDLSDVLTTVNEGEIISVGLLKEGFYKTKVDDKIGWINEEDVDLNVATEAPKDTKKKKKKKSDDDEEETQEEETKSKSSKSSGEKYVTRFSFGGAIINPTVLNQSYKAQDTDLNAISSDLRFSLGLGYKFMPKLTVMFDINYIMNSYPKTFTHQNKFDSKKYDDHTSISFIAPEVLAQYEFYKSGDFSFAASAGLGYSLSSKVSRSISLETQTTPVGTVTMTGSALLLDFDALLIYALSNKMGLSLNVGYQLLKLSNPTAVSTQTTATSISAQALAIYQVNEVNFSGPKAAIGISYKF